MQPYIYYRASSKKIYIIEQFTEYADTLLYHVQIAMLKTNCWYYVIFGIYTRIKLCVKGDMDLPGNHQSHNKMGKPHL